MENSEYRTMDITELHHPWFVAKRKFLSLVLKKNQGIVNGKKVLDVGCGTGAVMQFFSEEGYDVYGIDPSEEALMYCKNKRLAVKKSGGEQINFPSHFFDMVVALDVLEHIKNDIGTVQEIKRILKPGGIFICTVPAHAFLWSYHDEYLHHERRYSKKQLIMLLGSAGLEIKYMSFIHAFIFLPLIIIRIVKNILLSRPRTSDVKNLGWVTSQTLHLIYRVEIFFFQLLGRLPFGVSLISLSQKKRRYL